MHMTSIDKLTKRIYMVPMAKFVIYLQNEKRDQLSIVLLLFYTLYTLVIKNETLHTVYTLHLRIPFKDFRLSHMRLCCFFHFSCFCNQIRHKMENKDNFTAIFRER